MSIPNQELIQKAIIATDALAAAGKLNPAQSDKFIDYVVDESVLKNNARIVRFRNEQLEIDKIGIGRRVAVPKAEASAPSVRRGISTSKITLQPREVMVPFEISDTFMDVNIEGASVEDHIIKMMATQLANDMEELGLNGNTLGPAILEGDLVDGGSATKYVKDTYLALTNGWMKLADGAHVVDQLAANISLSTFSAMLRALPTKFRRNKGDLRFYLSSDVYQLYLEKLASRTTVLGDEAAGGSMHKPFGITPVELPLLDLMPPVTEHVVLNGTTDTQLLYAPVSNVVVTPATLSGTPLDAYSASTDYELTAATGKIKRRSGSTIGDGATVKVTYTSNPQILLTHQQNYIVGIGRDIRIEKDRDIFKGVNQYAITVKLDFNFEELDAVVKGKNIGTSIS